MARLQGALDNEINIACQGFITKGIPAEVDDLYNALQKSNSSLRRKPKKLLERSIERVLDFKREQGEDASSDSEVQAEAQQVKVNPDSNIMNKAMRNNLAPKSPAPAPAPESDDAPGARRATNGEPRSKARRLGKASHDPPQGLSLKDLGGMDDVKLQMKELVARPLLFPEEYQAMNVKVPKGVLLHGPPGCGKTMLSRACAAEMGLPFVEILGPSIVSGMSGESEKAVRERFEEAKRLAPCLIFMDEVDAIAPKRESSQSQMEKRIVAQLLVCMDELDRDAEKPVMVLATTNRPDSIDPALRRGGRFDTEINIGVPTEQVRHNILKAQTRKSPLAPDVDLKTLAKMTAGFVGADLDDFVTKAGSWQMRQLFDAMEAQMAPTINGHMDLDDPNDTSFADDSFSYLMERSRDKNHPRPPGFENRQITMQAFLAVLPAITPSSKREGFATVPDTTWADVGALQAVREELVTAIVEPIKHPELYTTMGMSAPAGVLLWGPPGCGKTLLAKAVAAESKANFISIKGPELLNKFVGESEAAVRRVFTRARSSVPCVIFFDELDALVPRRDDAGSEASARVVNTLLTELDGLNEKAGIYVIAATNRPDMIDEAMLRPGRLETPLFVDLPGPQERGEILAALLKTRPVESALEIKQLVESDSCAGFSGADVGALVREATMSAIKRFRVAGIGTSSANTIALSDFEAASRKVRPSVGDIKRYHKLRSTFGRT